MKWTSIHVTSISCTSITFGEIRRDAPDTWSSTYDLCRLQHFPLTFATQSLCLALRIPDTRSLASRHTCSERRGLLHHIARYIAVLSRSSNFTMSVNAAKQLIKSLLFDTKYAPVLAFLVILGDAVLTQLIIRFIRCKVPLPQNMAVYWQSPDTEIDWETYMYQVELYIKGERNYANISGPTGPLVSVRLCRSSKLWCSCSTLKLSRRTRLYTWMALQHNGDGPKYSLCTTNLWIALPRIAIYLRSDLLAN